MAELLHVEFTFDSPRKGIGLKLNFEAVCEAARVGFAPAKLSIDERWETLTVKQVLLSYNIPLLFGARRNISDEAGYVESIKCH